MGTKLYVANLDFKMTDRDLQKLFAPHGTIESAQVARDKETNRSRGFGFVEMASVPEAQAAIAALAGKVIQGRALIVEEYRPREEGSHGKRSSPPRARPIKEPRKRPPPLGSRLRRPRPKP